MADTVYDAIVIGGGPGGSSASTYLARAGKRVLLLEKEVFPRFHIGESLLPYNRQLFEEIGVLPALEAAGFITKQGAQFHVGNGSKSLKLIFRNGHFTREAEAFQVERARFDHILLQHAEKCGVEVRQGWSVSQFDNANPTEVRVEARNGGDPQTFRGRFLVDASGRGNLTGNQLGLRMVHPRLRKLAVFAHFKGVRLDPGPAGGDTVIVRLENKWFWIIPLSAEKISVGCVMDQEEYARLKLGPEGAFEHFRQASPVMRERLEQAMRLTPVQATSDFSYRNKRLTDARLLRVGDAAGFMDPIFSAGVYLAMYSGKLAAEAIGESLARNDDGEGRFKRYEKRVYRAMQLYWEMVEGFYTTPFMELFLEPREKLNIPSAVTALLAGELEGGWKIRWRMRLFFLLVRAQKRWPLVGRIRFN